MLVKVNVLYKMFRNEIAAEKKDTSFLKLPCLLYSSGCIPYKISLLLRRIRPSLAFREFHLSRIFYCNTYNVPKQCEIWNFVVNINHKSSGVI